MVLLLRSLSIPTLKRQIQEELFQDHFCFVNNKNTIPITALTQKMMTVSNILIQNYHFEFLTN